jgi:hypothetical protein
MTGMMKRLYLFLIVATAVVHAQTVGKSSTLTIGRAQRAFHDWVTLLSVEISYHEIIFQIAAKA